MLNRIRDRIVADPDAWVEAKMQATGGTGTLHASGALKRVPRGYDKAHPLAEDLKQKSFAAMRSLPDEAVFEDGFIEHYAQLCEEAAPMMRLLCGAVGVPY